MASRRNRSNDAKKAVVELDGIPLAGNDAIQWSLTTGVRPYTTVMTAHITQWNERLRDRAGRPLVLEITDARGRTEKIEDVYILHEAPNPSPNRVSFVVADKRWLWQYKIVARSFNITRRTGDRTADLSTVPIELIRSFDVYDYLEASLDGRQRWTARRALEEVLEVLEGEDRGARPSSSPPGRGGARSSRRRTRPWRIESLPIEGTGDQTGQFSLQNVTLADQGDVALSRLLAFIPGAEVYVKQNGQVTVFDGTDLDETERYFRDLPQSTWDADFPRLINRKAIRPNRVQVYYQREVECVFRFEDDYSGRTRSQPDPDDPYLENVIPTTDPITEIPEYDPVEDRLIIKMVPAGTWVRVDNWLGVMNDMRPEGSLPWTFDTIRRHWLKGDLDGVLGGRGLDLDPLGDVSMRIQALKQHFRQTFRINRRYMENIKELRNVRVATIDPVNAARAPAAVWGQACIIPSTKGKRMASRLNPQLAGVFRNVDHIRPSREPGVELINTRPAPTEVQLIDDQVGIFRLQWITSPYGTVDSYVPSLLVDAQGRSRVPVRDLAQQDDRAIGVGMQIESGTNGIFLANSLELAVIMTIVQASPNNERQYHREEVMVKDLSETFRREFRIQDGTGPDLEIFIPPGEATARFQWANDATAEATIELLLGLRDPNTNQGERGIEGPDLPGFVFINQRRDIQTHARSTAAEFLASFADNVQGTVSTELPEDGIDLVGNMTRSTVSVAAYPSAKVSAQHEFPGQQKPISRFALLPETVRTFLLGVIPYR